LPIPVIDIFAGPGGLGEGFCALQNDDMQRIFKIVLSVEKDIFAHQTLSLRSFFRQFEPNNIPDDYYKFLKGEIEANVLYSRWPIQAENAKKEALLATLGEDKDAISNNVLDKKILEALHGEQNWLLIGGPPCQAYSIVGRSRRKEKILDESKDERVGLYKQYLRILAVHNPAIFVMENVKGLLSAKTKDSSVFSKILQDLSDPAEVYREEYRTNGIDITCPGYKIYSVTVKPRSKDIQGKPIFKQKDFIIHSEKFGIPQARHRLIMLGIRNNIDLIPEILQTEEQIPISQVILGLPKLRGALSKCKDSGVKWKETIQAINQSNLLLGIDPTVKAEIFKNLENIPIPLNETGAEYLQSEDIRCNYQREWFLDLNLNGICNHSARSHMGSDLLRYFFVSCYAKVKKYSPKLEDFPVALLPKHKNVNEGINENKFGDRFRVQLWDRPSKTITSHIAKDGHYYIHPDPTQCRSFTVREAARIQTFPDNYYFCGPRTEQFHQVGNAVPPLLAKKIAIIVKNIFDNLVR
jgi:DNA (cytosine-5)-methyltransferase 1